MVPFKEIYDAHYTLVWRMLRRLGISDGDAPDAAQEVFLIVHKKVGEFEGRSSLKTWICGICMRVASNWKRSSIARREVLSGDMPLECVADQSANAEDSVDRNDRILLIERALNRMSFEQRAVFVLFEIEEFSGDEIANLIGISKSTVHSRLRLARDIFNSVCERSSRMEAR